MRYRILGPLGVQPVVEHPALQRRKPRIVLAMLLLHANEVVSTDALIDAVWGDSPPARARGSLQNYVSHLRKALGEERLVSEGSGYMLRVEPGELDAEVFERLVREASDAPAKLRAERLRSALALWRGPALADLAYEGFTQAAIKALDDGRGTAFEDLAAADLELGRHAEAAVELEALVAEYPWRERLRGQLMLALYRSGRQAEALEVYRDGRRLLREELGLDPGNELRELERAILTQDEALGAPPVASAEREPAPTVRKVVTVLFADVAGSTRLASSVDPELLRAVMGRFFGAMRAVAERHGGTLEKFSGDEVMVVFGVPTLHEDDALRAVRAAAEMRDTLAELNRDLERDHGVRLEIRIGVNTGEVVAGDPDETPFVTGEAVNVGKRLQEAAAPGDVLLAPVTVSLTRGSVDTEQIGTLEVRGRPEPVATHRLLGLVDESFETSRETGQLIGRRGELRRLRAAYSRVRRKRQATLAVVVGEAGIGKTRLVRQFVNGVDDARILVGHCVSYGEGATYLPLVEVVRQATREKSLDKLLVDVDEADQVARVLRVLAGELDEPFALGDASWAVQRFVGALAREAPVVLILDDVHWAEPALLDLVEQLVQHASGVPLLVLAMARPELVARRPQWAEHADGPVVVRLERLSDDDTKRLVASHGGTHLEKPVLERVVATAEGNPLFAEQLFSLVQERGPDALGSLPPTVEALIASRLDGLPRRERAALERAAVAGRDFRESELVALSPPDEAAIVPQTLVSLVHAGFVRRQRVAAADDTFAFQHVLIRDAAYAAVPKSRRAELHERLGDWLIEHGDAPDELVGFHLESAYRYLAELGPVGRHAGRLAEEAGERIGRAGMRAFQRGDLHAATNLLGRATSLLPESAERRRELLSELGLALRIAGEVDEGHAALREAVEVSRQADDRRLTLRAELELAGAEVFGKGNTDELLRRADDAIPIFETLADHRSLGRAWYYIGTVRGGFYVQNALWEEALERALVHYRASGWPPTAFVADFGSALFFGPRPVAEAVRRANALLGENAGIAGEANVLVWLAALDAIRGRFDDARRSVRRARAIYDELGFAVPVASHWAYAAALIESSSGDYAAAERLLHAGCESLKGYKQWGNLATNAAHLADVLQAQGTSGDAEKWAETARRHSTEQDVSAELSWRAALGRIRAAQGQLVEAESLAREALALVEKTDATYQHGNVLLVLAEVLDSAGKREEAGQTLDQAIDLFRAKGSSVAEGRAVALRREHVVA
ncbi:MAG TPA: BTAD domain-containing putative transcriptional regulator [Gaiellaceae bacterium]|nr:BTAD domain-containing putative transcriptional regulator [Gaiellaceae bacterium]